MKKTIFLPLILVFFLTGCSNPSGGGDNQPGGNNPSIWAKTVTAGNSASQFNAVAVDSSGNIYAAGYQYGTGDFNYGSGLIHGTHTYTNAVLVKYDASGQALWAKTVTAGSNNSQFYAVAVDSFGNIYAVGYQSGTGDFDYGSGNIHGTNSEGPNAVLVKYNASGQAQWAKTVTAGGGMSQFNAVAVDSSNNIYVAGFQNWTVSYDYGSGNITGTFNGSNAVLVKYNDSGQALWAKTVTTGNNDSYYYTVAVDSSGIYAAGRQSGTGSFNYGSGPIAGKSFNGSNAVLVKYDASGQAQWAKTVTAGSSQTSFRSVAVDSSGIYAAGYQYGSGNYDYGSGNIAGTNSDSNAVLVKYNALGQAQWAKTVTTGAASSSFNAVAINSSGIYTAGHQNGSGNAILVKYNASSGDVQWTKAVTAGSSASYFYAVAVYSSGIYTAGYQNGSGNFNYGSGPIAGTNNGYNAVLVKYID
jgi:outer membrane protein assembly factor BamB